MSNAITVKEKINKMKSAFKLDSVQEQIKNSLKENSGAFISSVVEMYSGDTYLQNCDPIEVMQQAIKAASLKLPINKNLGFCYVIPFKNKGKFEPNFQMGYKGYIQLAMRTGQYKKINAGSVSDTYEIEHDLLTGDIKFEKKSKEISRNIIGYFAYFELVNGFSKTLYMTKDEIMAHAERYSQSYKSTYSPWKNQFDEMATKTVLSKLLRTYGILSTEMQSAIISDSKDESFEPQPEANTEEFNPEKEIITETKVEEVDKFYETPSEDDFDNL